jgi:hypothetical protein
MFDNIPQELREYPQWVCWRFEDAGRAKPTKVPYCPRTGKLAAVDDPSTWATYDEAVKASTFYNGIGFVFTQHDPYTFIDLDDTRNLGDGTPNPDYQKDTERQTKIFQEFNSYSELSPSGHGLHIIIKGHVPHGCRRSNIEVYSSLRYATMTGNIYHHSPIAERQQLLTLLFSQMSKGAQTFVYSGDAEEKFTDDEVVNRALKAANGDKFKTLLDGRWNEIYPSQSEADFAFVDMIAFYTQNRNQIARIFRKSPLGQREKAQRNDYVTYMVNKSFDRMLPPVDIDGFANAISAVLAAAKEKEAAQANPSPSDRTNQLKLFNPSRAIAAPSEPTHDNVGTVPPGLLGDIAQFIYACSPRPVPEIALAGAIGFMAGICGRAFNVSGTGLNQYVLLLAATGTGKEAMALGMDKLIQAIRTSVPSAAQFIGPAEMASGQALLKYIATKSPCFVSVVGEFGLRMRSMSAQHANNSEIMLRRVLLDMYNKSGAGQTLRPSIYSDKDKNTDTVQSPALTILGESTPEKFYEILDEGMISEGFLPRFMTIEYTGPRVPLNTAHSLAMPSFQLIDQLSTLVSYAHTLMHGAKTVDVAAEPDANAYLNDYERYTTNQINGTNREVLRQLWSRAHMKLLKLAALVAVGVNPSTPVITLAHVEWAANLINRDIHNLLARFESGLIGNDSGELKQSAEVIRIVREYVTKPWPEIAKYSSGDMNMHRDRIIPYAYVSRRLIAVAAFRLDRSGATAAIKRAITALTESDTLREVPKTDMSLKYHTTQRAFVLSNPAIIMQ